MTMTHTQRARDQRAALQMPDWMEPCDQAQEHADHEAGCASDHQNAYALSQMQHRSGMAEVLALVAQGFHVVVMTGPAYCRSTDALISVSHHVCSYHLSRRVAEYRAGKAAEECDGGEESFAVYPRPPAPPRPVRQSWAPSPFDDDVPF